MTQRKAGHQATGPSGASGPPAAGRGGGGDGTCPRSLPVAAGPGLEQGLLVTGLVVSLPRGACSDPGVRPRMLALCSASTDRSFSARGLRGRGGSGSLPRTLPEHPHFSGALALSRGPLPASSLHNWPPLCLADCWALSGPCWGLVLVAHKPLTRARGRGREGDSWVSLWQRGLRRNGASAHTTCPLWPP